MLSAKLVAVALTAGLCLIVYAMVMRSSPGRGLHFLLERLAIGLALVFLMNGLLAMLSIQIAQNPITALTTGLLGMPGAAFSLVVQSIP